MMINIDKKKITLKGTHGTSVSRAESILKYNRFTPTEKECVLMSGVYLWAYEDDITFAKALAKNWWSFSSNKFNEYKNDLDSRLAIIKACIRVGEDSYFDTSSDFFSGVLLETAKKRGIKPNADNFRKLLVLLVAEIEEEINASFSVIKAIVNVPGKPPGKNSTPMTYLIKKQAPCYVVMNNSLGVINSLELLEV